MKQGKTPAQAETQHRRSARPPDCSSWQPNPLSSGTHLTARLMPQSRSMVTAKTGQLDRNRFVGGFSDCTSFKNMP